MTPMQLRLNSNTIPVTLADGEAFQEYELREMDALSRDRYLDSMSTRMGYDGEGKPARIKKFEGLQAELISLCLFDKAKGERVPAATIQSWPASVVTQLYAGAQQLNHLVAAAEEPSKNV